MTPGPAYYFSASQVETFMNCPRKWGWRYIAKIEPTSHESAQVGDAAHDELERYLKGGAIDFTRVVHGVRIGDVIAPGLGLLPLPERVTPELVETKFNFRSARGFNWTGRKDLECIDSDVFPTLLDDLRDKVEGPIQVGCPVVEDHKTSGNLSYAKTPESLEWDVQANLYAYELAQRRKAPIIDLVWTYYQTKGAKKAKRVHLRVLREHAEEAFRRIETVAIDMAAHHASAACELDKGAYVLSMKPNVNHCESYGKCPYQSVCQLTITERFQASMSNGGDFFSNLANVVAAQDAANPLAVPPAASLFGDPTLVPAPTEIPAAFLPAPTPAPVFGPVNPPEGTLPPPVVVAPAAPAVAAPAERKPGRPKLTDEEKAARAAAKAAKPVETTTSAAPAVEHVTRTEDAPKPVNRMGRFDLYVDCIPDGYEVTYADDLISYANDKVVEQSKATGLPVAHYKFLQFGQAAGALDIALQQVLDEAKPQVVFCSGMSEALPTLTKRAGRITRSVR